VCGAEEGEAELVGHPVLADIQTEEFRCFESQFTGNLQPISTNFNGRRFFVHCNLYDMGWDGHWQQSLAALPSVTPAQCCQAIFLLAAGGVLAVAVMPRDAKTLLVDYGARKAQEPPTNGPPKPASADRGWLLSLIDTVTSWTQVPHAWFGAFYVVSLACSVFWLAQYLGDGAVLRFVASSQAAARQPSATAGQAALGWFMMFLQGARRVFEHATIIKPSKSTMWVVHWLLGLLFYLTISVSVWVEGSRTASRSDGGP
jgi:3-oxo-5-alpha-steroid 4-dehydrogenase 3